MTQTFEHAEWAQALASFTQRNAGRRTALEVDGAALGAQIEEHDLPLRGVTYDPRDGRVSIMLGDMADTDRHITRGIAQPSAIELLEVAGRDRALRIAHDDGQTLLRLI